MEEERNVLQSNGCAPLYGVIYIRKSNEEERLGDYYQEINSFFQIRPIFLIFSSPLILQLILLNCSLRWAPPTTILFQYPVLSLQCHLWTPLSRGAFGIMPLLNGRTSGSTMLISHGMISASVSETHLSVQSA